MPWIYALELLALIGVAWLIAARLGAIAKAIRDIGGDDDDE